MKHLSNDSENELRTPVLWESFSSVLEFAPENERVVFIRLLGTRGKTVFLCLGINAVQSIWLSWGLWVGPWMGLQPATQCSSAGGGFLGLVGSGISREVLEAQRGCSFGSC